MGGILRNSGVQEVRYLHEMEISLFEGLDLEVGFLPFHGSLASVTPPSEGIYIYIDRIKGFQGEKDTSWDALLR